VSETAKSRNSYAMVIGLRADAHLAPTGFHLDYLSELSHIALLHTIAL